MRRLLRQDNVTTAIIFCNRKTTVRELAKSLKEHGFSAGEIHGDMDQSSRIAELDRFKDGSINLLVASDVAARGLDIKGVSHVFNFDAPWHPDDYVHRIGRTGRAGATGRAFTFVTPDDAEAICNVEKLIGGAIPEFAMAGDPREASADSLGTAAPVEPERKDRRGQKARAPQQPPKKAARQRPGSIEPPRPQLVDAGDDGNGGWNGPVPDFLGFSAFS